MLYNSPSVVYYCSSTGPWAIRTKMSNTSCLLMYITHTGKDSIFIFEIHTEVLERAM